MYDYQAMCKVPYHHHSGARPLLSPIYAFLAAMKWLISDFLIFLLEFNMSSFWHSDNLADAKAVFHHSHKHKKHDILQPCDTEYPVFVYEPAIKETNGLIECGDCQKMFVAQQIASSNLLLLITDAACDCSVFPPVLLDAKEVKYILPCAARMHGSTGPLISMFARVENMLPGQLLQGWGHGLTCGTAGERQGAGRVAVWWRGGNDSAIQPPQGDAHLHWPGCQIRCTRVRVGQARRKGQWWGGCSWAGSPTLLPGASVTHPCWILIPRFS
uniref:Voltage-dependent calcium channel alpha-2/delta subunit conserved region domain-containing protein n=1 Tax=Accipiter nisus TaxID=211598 RepID=A0A8B9MZ23_9AVES